MTQGGTDPNQFLISFQRLIVPLNTILYCHWENAKSAARTMDLSLPHAAQKHSKCNHHKMCGTFHSRKRVP